MEVWDITIRSFFFWNSTSSGTRPDTRSSWIVDREFFLNTLRESAYSWFESESFVLHDIADHIAHRRLDESVVQWSVIHRAYFRCAKHSYRDDGENKSLPPRQAVDTTSTVAAMTRMMTIWATVKKKGVSWR